MKVTLVDYNVNALNLLLMTKETRLKSGKSVHAMSESEKLEEFAYMRDTIKSSWEFCDYVFKIDGVTRAFTHQFVRTRTNSYAQEAQRAIDASDNDIVEPLNIYENEKAHGLWVDAICAIHAAYSGALELGIAPQDARGVLPTNITTSIMVKTNLRTLHDQAKIRLCTRSQGEYQNVFRRMRNLIQLVHPWTDGLFEPQCVAEGNCAFPRYGSKSCPAWFDGLDNTAIKEVAKEKFWGIGIYEANPIAKDGRAM